MQIARSRRPLQVTLQITVGTIILSTVISSLIQYFAGNTLGLVHFTLAIGMPIILVPPTIFPLIYANIRLREMRAELEQQTRTDLLTGLPNRRAFFEQAGRIFAGADGQMESVAVMMVDVDRFKQINDAYGHDAGDFVLRTGGEQLHKVVLSDAVCTDAMVARIGGEEFAVIVSGVFREKASDLAARICDAVRQTTCIFRGHSISTTVSVGVAMRAPGQDIDTVLKAADIAAYEAKGRGRNRWCLMPPAGEAMAPLVPDQPALPYRTEARVA